MTTQETVARLRRASDDARVVAESLEEARPETAGGVAAIFLEFFDDLAWEQFPAEEDVVLRALASDAAGLALADRVRTDHARLRLRATALRHSRQDDPEALRELGALLREHLELEEREVYTPISAACG